MVLICTNEGILTGGISELHGKHAGSISKMLVEVKKQIPGTPARRARRHALSSFDQLNKAERERLGKINPLHKRYDLYIKLERRLERAIF